MLKNCGHSVVTRCGTSPPHNHPDRVDDAGHITAQRQKNVEPEVQPQSDLEKYTNWRQDDGDENTNDVHDDRLSG